MRGFKRCLSRIDSAAQDSAFHTNAVGTMAFMNDFDQPRLKLWLDFLHVHRVDEDSVPLFAAKMGSSQP